MVRAFFPTLRLVVLFAGALTMLVLVVGVPATAEARTKSFNIPVTGSLSDGGTFKGKIQNPEVTTNGDGTLSLQGVLKGTATLVDGSKKSVNEPFTTSLTPSIGGPPNGVVAEQDKCKILTLDLGPIHLDLLGLVVDLSDVHLDVTAVRGAGNLLGNLLCAIAGLLDPSQQAQALNADFLNGLLEALFKK